MLDSCPTVRKGNDLRAISLEIRKIIIDIAYRAKSPHVGSSLSCVDILSVLYFEVLNLNRWDERDIFILSKGHAAMALYGTLAVKGIIERNLLNKYCQNDGSLPAHLDKFAAKGIEVSAGSLGHGFNIGLGIAHGFRLKNSDRKVYSLIGDGESQEGSIWEGALFASKLGLHNFTAIMDYNNLQGYGRANELCFFEPVRAKWEAFGWHVVEVEGHDYEALKRAFDEDPSGRPKIIIARTLKGKGISFMEDRLEWHYFIVNEERRKRAMEELG